MPSESLFPPEFQQAFSQRFGKASPAESIPPVFREMQGEILA